MKKVLSAVIVVLIGAAILYVLENWCRLFGTGSARYVDPDDFEERLR